MFCYMGLDVGEVLSAWELAIVHPEVVESDSGVMGGHLDVGWCHQSPVPLLRPGPATPQPIQLGLERTDQQIRTK